ncbi:MAG: hypothetical protein IPN29_09895 [Saprospiraceae bacterium]|nr:hypothetical protein [Saprospiraceae bacterium]
MEECTLQIMPKIYYHICNPSTPEQPGIKNVYSLKDLQKVKEDATTVYLINAHLNWEGRRLSGNYGFDISNELRAKLKSKAPFIFYSPIQVKYFEQESKNDIRYKILFGSGSAFINFPFTYQELRDISEKLKPLSNAGLHDVVTMLCNVKGLIIDKLNHNLKWGVDSEKIIAQIKPYLSIEQQRTIDFDVFSNALSKASGKQDFDAVVQNWVEVCTSRLTEDVQNYSYTTNFPYKVLLVDDVQEYLDKAKQYLSSDFDILTTKSCEEAIQILAKDGDNKILAVIADWRLYDTTNPDYWQAMQGYEVLAFAARNGIRSLIALTSQSEYIVHRLRELLGIWFSLYKKQHLEKQEQWQLFSNMLADACLRTNEAILNRPTATNWTSNRRKDIVSEFSPKEIYAIFRSNGKLSEIEDKADIIWQSYLDKHQIRYRLNELSTTYITFDTTEEMLVQRRIFLGLYHSEFSIDDICCEMSKDPKKGPGKNDITQLKSKLCIKNEDLTGGKILIEETAWLKNGV